MTPDVVRLTIDFENPGTEWWESGGRDMWESILEGFDNNSAVLDRSLAESWVAQASQLPGWDGGPEHSPHPIRIDDVDEDEVL
jgi:hypothetical protein